MLSTNANWTSTANPRCDRRGCEVRQPFEKLLKLPNGSSWWPLRPARAGPSQREPTRERPSPLFHHARPETAGASTGRVARESAWLLVSQCSTRIEPVPGRDDEFVAVILKTYTGMRWGEVVGLETRFAYVFRGQGTARTAGHRGAKRVAVARRGDVWTGVVSNVLNHRLPGRNP